MSKIKKKLLQLNLNIKIKNIPLDYEFSKGIFFYDKNKVHL